MSQIYHAQNGNPGNGHISLRIFKKIGLAMGYISLTGSLFLAPQPQKITHLSMDTTSHILSSLITVHFTIAVDCNGSSLCHLMVDFHPSA